VEPPTRAVAERLLTSQQPPLNWDRFAEALAHGQCTRLAGDLGALQAAVTAVDASLSGPGFWGSTGLLLFACRQALRYADLFPERIPIVDDGSCDRGAASRVVEWTQAQCLCILCNAFLCSWPQRTSHNCHCTERAALALALPSINFDEMHCARGNFGPQQAKCEMFLHYLAKQQTRLQSGDELTRMLRFVRHKIALTEDGVMAAAAVAGVRAEPGWLRSTRPLRPVEVRPLRESIDEAKDMLRADFANESIGGGSSCYYLGVDNHA
jgi:hypothetical protein